MDIDTLQTKYRSLAPVLNERSRRLWAATEARAIGHGGIALVERATGIARSTIVRGLDELDAPAPPLAPERVRRPGGGRKRALEQDPGLRTDLDALVEPSTSGDPDSPLRWTSKSVRRLADELKAMGHQASYRVVADLLHESGYSLQANRKTREGAAHPDRDVQFQYLNERVGTQQRRGEPVISVDTKKKELVGDFKNAGRQWRPKGIPEPVRVHDFVIPEQGKAIPYGVYDLSRNEGWVSIGIDHDTASFAVHALERWWEVMGRAAYPEATSLLVTADGGGSNGSRLRLWKWELQQFANRSGRSITVCHLPPGTSKWNKIEHRLFSFISLTWKGQPLLNYETVVNLIGATKTKSGLQVKAILDTNEYETGVKVTKSQMEEPRIRRHKTHPDWNYTLEPRA